MRRRTLYVSNSSPTAVRFSIELGSAASMADQRYGDTDSEAEANPHASFVAAARARAQVRALRLTTVARESRACHMPCWWLSC